jgi:transketolase
MSAFSDPSLDNLCINTLRTLSIDAVQKANSGHPGLPLGAAPMAYVLFDRYLKHNPLNPEWYDRDRFVLSAGHGSMLLYSLLHMTGYALSLDEIQHFRQWNSSTPGHPEKDRTPGVEVTTGPLGQGFANGVGMAIAEAYLAARYNRPHFLLFDHYTYSIVSDGDLMEGVAAEAASLAGHLHLGKLIYLYDDNHVTLSASTQLAYTEDFLKRFEALLWHTQIVEDGNDLVAIDRAIAKAREVTDKPSLIAIRTHIGYGAPHRQDTFEAHGSPLGEDEVKDTKEALGWPKDKTFYIPEEAQAHFRKAIVRGEAAEEKWNVLLEDYEKQYPVEARELRLLMKGELPDNWQKDIPVFTEDQKGMATRAAGGKILQAICQKLPGLFGGSGDLNPSTYTEMKNQGTFECPSTKYGDMQGVVSGVWSYAGRNLFFGVREHAMGSISNGIATFKGLIPYCSTFLVFSDYMRPSIRLAALMGLHVIYVFTHDSIGLGEDGPTHQPVEQLASLRAIPHLLVIRPADANETAAAWQVAIESKNRPAALIFSRQAVPTLNRSELASAEQLRKGAYILADAPNGRPSLILIASGSEVHLIVEVRKKLQQQGIAVRCVSMPCWELFEEQSREYKESVFPPSILARVAVEAGSPQGWDRYVGSKGAVIGVSIFGSSAPGEIVMKEYGFSVENICDKAIEVQQKLRTTST